MTAILKVETDSIPSITASAKTSLRHLVLHVGYHNHSIHVCYPKSSMHVGYTKLFPILSYNWNVNTLVYLTRRRKCSYPTYTMTGIVIPSLRWQELPAIPSLHDDGNGYTQPTLWRELLYPAYTMTGIAYPVCAITGIIIPSLHDDGNCHTQLTRWRELPYQGHIITGIVIHSLHDYGNYHIQHTRWRELPYRRVDLIMIHVHFCRNGDIKGQSLGSWIKTWS